MPDTEVVAVVNGIEIALGELQAFIDRTRGTQYRPASQAEAERLLWGFVHERLRAVAPGPESDNSSADGDGNAGARGNLYVPELVIPPSWKDAVRIDHEVLAAISANGGIRTWDWGPPLPPASGASSARDDR